MIRVFRTGLVSLLFTLSFVSSYAQRGSHEKYGQPAKFESGIIIKRSEFVYAFNRTTGFANWVLHRLGKDDFGPVPRFHGPFFKDSLLPIDLPRPTNTDFENSGFDKGHAVRSEERTCNNEANRQTFVMSNVFPQRPELNRGPWLDCERWVEKMCKDSTYEFWIVVGPVYEKDKVEYLNKKTKMFPVPQWVFKVMLVKKPDGKLEKIAVLMPNINGIRKLDWKSYVVPLQKVEEVTGYKFFGGF
jgi:endonuclease G